MRGSDAVDGGRGRDAAEIMWCSFPLLACCRTGQRLDGVTDVLWERRLRRHHDELPIELLEAHSSFVASPSRALTRARSRLSLNSGYHNQLRCS